MRRIVEMAGELALLGIGVGGLWMGLEVPLPAAVVLFVMGALLLLLRLLSVGFVSANHQWPSEAGEPLPLKIGATDYGKALVTWLLAYRRTYAMAPGLYYTGERYDPDAPLLVTANYHLTVFLLARRLRRTPVRLLVIDTDGINVWCAAGKGRFGNAEIEKQLARYPALRGGDKRLPMILPKFGFAGVDLRGLRDLGVRPIIGPLYAKDLPAYLASPPLRNRDQERVRFGLQSRLFVLVPGLLQISAILALVTALLWLLMLPWGRTVPMPVGIVAVGVALAVIYPLLYPWLPGRRFAVKGLVLGSMLSGALTAAYATGWLSGSVATAAAAVLLTLGSGILMGLEFTGNSAVSNYSRVKQEMGRFLPATMVLYVAALVTFVAMGVPS